VNLSRYLRRSRLGPEIKIPALSLQKAERLGRGTLNDRTSRIYAARPFADVKGLYPDSPAFFTA
jgi:hypothetical protein